MGGLLAVMATVLPAKSYLEQQPNAQSKVTSGITSTAILPAPVQPTTITPHLLTVATVQDENTYFVDKNSSHDYEHGFGYDVARGYASHLQADLAVKVWVILSAACIRNDLLSHWRAEDLQATDNPFNKRVWPR